MGNSNSSNQVEAYAKQNYAVCDEPEARSDSASNNNSVLLKVGAILSTSGTVLAAAGVTTLCILFPPLDIPVAIVGCSLFGVSSATAAGVLISLIVRNKPSRPAQFDLPSANAGDNPPTYEQMRSLLRDEAKRDYGIDSINKVNICFAGTAGTGKSSLINAIRGVKPTKRASADSSNCEVAQPSSQDHCTCEVKPYYFPSWSNSHIVLWDIPGSGCPDFPWNSYFDKLKLYVFDAILIVCGNRVTEADIELAKQAHIHGVPYFFVRSRSDTLINEHLYDQDCDRSQTTEEELQKVRIELRARFLIECTKLMKTADLPPPSKAFLVSSRTFYLNESTGRLNNDAIDEGALLDEVLASIAGRRYDLKD